MVCLTVATVSTDSLLVDHCTSTRAELAPPPCPVSVSGGVAAVSTSLLSSTVTAAIAAEEEEEEEGGREEKKEEEEDEEGARALTGMSDRARASYFDLDDCIFRKSHTRTDSPLDSEGRYVSG